MKTQNEIAKIASSILEEMGGAAEDICCGDCTTYAKRLVDAIGCGKIVSTMDDDMNKELDGYEVIRPSEYLPMAKHYPHCWVSVDGIFYDAFDTDGVDAECSMYWNQIA